MSSLYIIRIQVGIGTYVLHYILYLCYFHGDCHNLLFRHDTIKYVQYIIISAATLRNAHQRSFFQQKLCIYLRIRVLCS